MKSFTVLAAHYDEVNDRMEVVKEITADDGTTSLNLQIFHPDTLEWRAAVYGIDDHNELIDLIVHEPFMEDINPLHKSLEETRTLYKTRIAAAKAKFKTNGRAVRVLASMDIKAKLSAAGVARKYVDAVSVDPYEAIRASCKIDKDSLKEKQDHIKEVRRQIASEQPPEKVRPGQLRAQLNNLRRDHPQEVVATNSNKLPPIHLDEKGKRIR